MGPGRSVAAPRPSLPSSLAVAAAGRCRVGLVAAGAGSRHPNRPRVFLPFDRGRKNDPPNWLHLTMVAKEEEGQKYLIFTKALRRNASSGDPPFLLAFVGQLLAADPISSVLFLLYFAL